jgi:hypothetical protein
VQKICSDLNTTSIGNMAFMKYHSGDSFFEEDYDNLKERLLEK